MPKKPTRGSAEVLGTKALRYSGIQGGLLATANALHFASVAAVAFFLGPADFGRYGLLLFLVGLLTLLFNLASKQGTLKRVFGTSGDDDDDEADEDEEATTAAAGEDRRSLGTGLVLTAIVSVIGTALVVAFAEPISQFLLGTSEDRELIVFAGLAGGLGAIFRLSSLVLWLERRPGPHVAVEVARPLLILAGVLAFVIPGGGIEGAIAGNALGSAVALGFSLVMLRRSYEWAFSFSEARQIYRRGAPRIPIVISMWTIQNADIFILSRFVTDADLGVYQLASRVGLLVAFLPGGFRMAMRPLRKTLAYKSVQRQYGRAVARGQELAYFVLLCISTELAVVLLSEVLARAAPSGYADAAGLIPLLAAAMMGPSIMRQISRSVSIPRKKLNFIGSVIIATLIFIGSTVVLVREIGVKAAPVSMLIAFGITGAYLLLRGQLGGKPVRIPYRALLGAGALAAACGLAYHLVDPGTLAFQIGLAFALFAAYHLALLRFGGIPRQHWGALYRVARGFIGRPTTDFRARRALRKLGDVDREALRLAIREGRPVAEIPDALAERGMRLPAGEPTDGDGAAASERLVAAVRRAAAEGGMEVPVPRDNPGGHDARIAAYLFPEGTVAQRDARMRGLLSVGVGGKELLALEAVVEGLQRAPEEAWQSDARP